MLFPAPYPYRLAPVVRPLEIWLLAAMGLTRHSVPFLRPGVVVGERKTTPGALAALVAVRHGKTHPAVLVMLAATRHPKATMAARLILAVLVVLAVARARLVNLVRLAQAQTAAMALVVLSLDRRPITAVAVAAGLTVERLEQEDSAAAAIARTVPGRTRATAPRILAAAAVVLDISAAPLATADRG